MSRSPRFFPHLLDYAAAGSLLQWGGPPAVSHAHLGELWGPLRHGAGCGGWGRTLDGLGGAMQLIPLAFWQEKWTHQPTGVAYWYSLGWLTQCLGGTKHLHCQTCFCWCQPSIKFDILWLINSEVPHQIASNRDNLILKWEPPIEQPGVCSFGVDVPGASDHSWTKILIGRLSTLNLVDLSLWIVNWLQTHESSSFF